MIILSDVTAGLEKLGAGNSYSEAKLTESLLKLKTRSLLLVYRLLSTRYDIVVSTPTGNENPGAVHDR